jgi:hypothetical protein
MPAVPKVASSFFSFLPYQRNNQDTPVRQDDDSTRKQVYFERLILHRPGLCYS